MIGSFHFQPMRVLILVSLLRILVRSEYHGLSRTTLDSSILLYALLVAFSSLFHQDIKQSLIFRMGHLMDMVGTYAIYRFWFRDFDDIRSFFHQCLILLGPLAFFIGLEQATGHNLFSYVGGGSLESGLREGRFRASGPFRHAILAGTFCAVFLPMIIYYWRYYRSFALMSLAFMLISVVTCASSGPILTVAAAGFALLLWNYREKLTAVKWSCLLGLLVLHFIMKDPVWYIIARIDLAGGSTGWHRAKLIDSSIEHFGEWWFAGSDYTRHWMPTGVSWSPDHCDITNHYIYVGVIGGFPALLAFILIIKRSFQFISQSLSNLRSINPDRTFYSWCLGATLFAHLVSMIGIGYFDQVLLAEFLALITAIQVAWISSSNDSFVNDTVPALKTAVATPEFSY